MALPPFTNGFQPFLQRNSDTLLAAGAGLLSGSTPQEQVAGLAQGVAGARQRNKTLEFLRQQNPELAAAVESGALSGGDAYKLFYQQKLEAQKPKNNYMAVGKNLYDASTGQWITPPAGAGDPAEYGLNPVYGTDENGNTVIGQVAKDGSFHQVDTKGFRPVGTTSNLNLGTMYQTRDRAGNVIGNAPIDIAGKNAQEAAGTAQGQASAQVNSARQTVAMVDKQIQDLKNDPYLPNMLGSVPYTGGMVLRSDLPNRSPEANRVQGRINQLQGGAFLQARQLLQGGGQITDFEGKKAEDAFSRLSTAQNDKDFKQALDDFDAAVKEGLRKLEANAAGQRYQPSQPGVAPSASNTTSTGVPWSIEP